jgi:hypothetical protein
MGKRIRHVVHVIHSLQVGGTENGLVNVVNALTDEFHHTVIAITAGGPLEARLSRGVDLIALGKQPGVDVRAIIRLAGLLRRLRPDIVHSRNWGAFDAIYAARLARVPVVIHGEHGREASDPEGLDPRRIASAGGPPPWSIASSPSRGIWKGGSSAASESLRTRS